MKTIFKRAIRIFTAIIIVMSSVTACGTNETNSSGQEANRLHLQSQPLEYGLVLTKNVTFDSDYTECIDWYNNAVESESAISHWTSKNFSMEGKNFYTYFAYVTDSIEVYYYYDIETGQIIFASVEARALPYDQYDQYLNVLSAVACSLDRSISPELLLTKMTNEKIVIEKEDITQHDDKVLFNSKSKDCTINNMVIVSKSSNYMYSAKLSPNGESMNGFRVTINPSVPSAVQRVADRTREYVNGLVEK